jgi:ABC-type glycerol-3-phosphate transport system substrate-binding protein
MPTDGNDQLYGFFYNVNVKSLVWYVPENFEDAGYEVPTTMEELKALTEQIVPTARCRGASVWARARDRLAGDRLGRGHDAAHPAAGGL